MVRPFTKAVAAVTGVLAASLLLISSPASAIAVTQLGASAFTHSTLPQTWVAPAPVSGTNNACLTASGNAALTPIPGCGFATPDADGSGALRLTSNGASKVGTVFYNLSLPTSQGLDINFNTYQYNGTGADGIAFMLAAADPSNPSPPASSGPTGGSLGYSATGGNAGLPNGYLGLGLDVFGNYTNSTFSGTGCSLPGGIAPTTQYPQALTARGPGNGTTGYCILSSTAQSGGLGVGKRLDNLAATSRAGLAVPVEVAINPGTSPITTTTGLSVAASSYVIAATPIGGTQHTVTGLLPTVTNNSVMASTFPPSWINPTTGIPYQLTLGWAASTGGSNEIHEIDSLASSTVSGQLPVYTVAGATDATGGLPEGGTANYTLTPSLSGSEGSESSPITVTSTFPAGIVPGNASGTGWTCTTSAQTVSCVKSPGSAIAAGTSLPPITVPTTVASGSTGSKTVNVKVSSVDGLPASTQVTATVVHAPSAPGSVTGTATGTTAAVSWTTPVSNGGSPITSYTVTATPNNGGNPVTTTVTAPATSATVTGLTPNVTYTFTVAANNIVGAGSGGGTGSPITTTAMGYWTVGADGGVFAFGDAGFYGSANGLDLVQPVVAMTPTPDRGGYWLAAADGGVFAYGDAKFYGSSANGVLKAKITGIAATADGGGYWLVDANGAITTFGDAVSYGDTTTFKLSAPIVGIAATPSGNGYRLVGADGGVFGYGDATFDGNALNLKLNGPIVGISSLPHGDGYLLTGSDGGVFAYGDAAFNGNALNLKLEGAIVGIAATPSGNGYWLTGADGGVFAYGDAQYLGSMAGKTIKKPMTYVAAL